MTVMNSPHGRASSHSYAMVLERRRRVSRVPSCFSSRRRIAADDAPGIFCAKDRRCRWPCKLAAGTLTLGEAFSFMSGLYFRGKLAYAQAFGRHETPVLVITPTRGLLSPETPVTRRPAARVRGVDVDADDRRYRRPLDRSVRTLARSPAAPTARVVLLGSIATGKYVDVLTRAFGDRLHFPSDFVGRGDMSRGGLMLRWWRRRPSSPTSARPRGSATRDAPAEASRRCRRRPPASAFKNRSNSGNWAPVGSRQSRLLYCAHWSMW